MPFTPWQTIPTTTAVRELFTTSLLLSADDPPSGVLVRCSPGLHEGSATVVHATIRRPNALRMLGVDDDIQVDALAQVLLGNSHVQIVAIPHITWKSVGRGLPWRTTIAAVGALLTALLLSTPPLSFTPWTALPLGTSVGMMAWLLLRRRVPTRIGPRETPLMTVDDVVKRITSSQDDIPDTASGTRSPSGSRRRSPPLR